MPNSLKLLFEDIDQARSESDLRSQVVPKIRAYFAAKRCGIFFFDQLPVTDRNAKKILDLALSIEHNPVARYLVERHAPVHEALVTSPKAWKIICPRPDHWHVMAGPIIDRNQLVGAVGCTREKSMPAFDSSNLTDLSAVCLHLSVWAATVRVASVFINATDLEAVKKPQHQPSKPGIHWGSQADRLTPRELQIAELVALGQTNGEIGHQLWITENSVKQALKRMFRKLEVSSRAEMVAHLAATRQVSPTGNSRSM
jgi:DNA-binding CsgD family transcriptional regulator